MAQAAKPSGENGTPSNDEVDDSPTALNTQIVEAVTFVNKIMAEHSQSVGSGLAYQSVCQMAAMAVQDAETHMRNVMTLSVAVMGAANREIMENPGSADDFFKIIDQAQLAVQNAIAQFQLAGEAAAKLVSDFPVQAGEAGAASKN